MATGENVLWVIDHVSGSKEKLYVFRTKAAAIAFRDAKNAKVRSRYGSHYFGPTRATWGPDNV